MRKNERELDVLRIVDERRKWFRKSRKEDPTIRKGGLYLRIRYRNQRSEEDQAVWTNDGIKGQGNGVKIVQIRSKLCRQFLLQSPVATNAPQV